MKRFLIIADDFTGANDTGVQLSKRGISTKVFLKTLTNQTADSYVIDTESRNMPSETAYSHLEKIIAPIDFEPFDFVIKKVDSTLRGNILEELQAVDAAYQSELILFMPALPDLGRTTVEQIHYINGQRLLDTEIANDPVKPVTTDNIQTLLQNAFPDETVHALSLDAISADAEAFQNGRLWAVDAQTNHDMQTIIQLALQTQKKILWVGSAGIADNLMALEMPTAPALALVGSVSEVTKKQIQYAEKHNIAVIQVPIHEILLHKNRSQYAAKIAQSLAAGKDTIVLSSASYHRSELGKTMETCAKLGIKPEDVNFTVQSILGDITRRGMQDQQIAGIFLTGGDTAIGFLDQLACSTVEILEEVLIGIPLMRVCGTENDGLKIITKAGAFGNEDAIYFAMKKLKSL